MNIQSGLKETFSVKTAMMIILAFVGYTVARALQKYAFSRVSFLASYPEVADVVTVVAAASLLRGDTAKALVIGGGLSLLNNLGARFGIPWLGVK